MVDERHHVQNDPYAKQRALDDDEAPGTNHLGNRVGKHSARRQCELGYVASWLLRAKFSQPLLVFGTQVHLVALVIAHSLHPQLGEVFHEWRLRIAFSDEARLLSKTPARYPRDPARDKQPI